MTAEGVRKRGLADLGGLADRIGEDNSRELTAKALCLAIPYLAEIAAQLAELNSKLAIVGAVATIREDRNE